MGWSFNYTSIAGIFTGRVPFDEPWIPSDFTSYVTWLPMAGSDYAIQALQSDAYGPPVFDPTGQYPDAFSFTDILDFPCILFTLRGESHYLRFVLDSSGLISVETSTDGTVWSAEGSYSGFNQSTVIYPTHRYIGDMEYIGMIGWQYSSYLDRWTWKGIFWSLDEWQEDIDDKMEGDETSPEYGDASGPGGYDGGTFDDSSDTIGVPAMPTIGVSSIGFVNVYNPSTGALASLGEDLFPDFTPINPYSPTGDTVIDAITDVAEALANIAQNIPNAIEMFNNSQLINYIIDCHIIPVTPTSSGSQAIKIGYRTMSQAAPKVTSDYVDCDCGSLNIGEYYRNFIDYGPYTQAKLFLPFVGFVPIEPELFQSGVLKVVYRFNVIDGSFMAFVLSTSSKSRLSNTVIGQWGGNACVHIPITGVNYSNMVSGIAAGASAVVAEIGKGSLIGAADAALNTAAAAPALQSSNGYNATTSFLSVRTPYLVIERSVSHYSKDYGHEQGYPSEITADWSKLSGYTESDAIHLEGLGATEEEMKEIASLLAAGVIL